MIDDRRPRANRSPEYTELVSILARGGPGGALVLGGSGMGKTSLVEHAMERPDVAPPVLRLHCSTTLSSVPYGALSPYLSSLERLDDPVRVLREISVILEEGRNDESPPLVLVEDAQFLDPESSFILSMLVENSAIKLIVIGSGRIDGESTLFSLTDSGLLTTIVVQPLDMEAVRQLTQAMTGGRVAEGTVEVIRAMTGGNPGLVKAFVQSCLNQGVLLRDEQSLSENEGSDVLWVLARLAPEPDDALIEVVREMHSFLPPGQQRSLELLALGGHQARALLVACVGSDYRHLLESGILTVNRDEAVGFRAEVHGLVLRHIIAPGRSAKLHASWDARRRDLGLELSPQQVLWSLEVRAEVSSADVLDAIEAANDSLDYPLAWKLCRVSGITDTSGRGILAECRTLSGLGRLYSARAKLVRLAEETDDPADLQQALNMLASALDRLGLDRAEMENLENLWRDRARKSENRAGFDHAAQDHARVTEILELWQAVQTTESGPVPRDRAARILSQPGMPSENRIVLLTMLSDLCSVQGETETALSFAREAMAELDQDAGLNGIYQLRVLFRVGWNLVFSGRYSEAEEFLTQRCGPTVRLMLHRQGTLCLIRGIGQLLRGQTESAQTTLAEAMAEFRLRDPSRLALAEMFYEAAQGNCVSGQSPSSSASVSDQETSKRDPRVADGQEAAEPEATRRLLNRAVAAGLAGPKHPPLKEFPLIEREVIACSEDRRQVEDGNGEALNHRLTELVKDMEGPRASLLSRLSAAQEDGGNPEELIELGRDASQAEEFRIAVEAMARSAKIFSERGDNRSCGMVLRDLANLLREQQIRPGPFEARTLAMAELTKREEEIVDLARGGRNNAEIARALTVSQRTVEGHLYRVFSKLGINDRSELMDLRLHAGTPRD